VKVGRLSAYTQFAQELADGTGEPSSEFNVIVTYDGALGGQSDGYIYLGSASGAEDELGGYVDVLFFAGINEQPQCNIHDQCGKYSCYAFRNLVGEYSGDNHIREGACIQNVQPEWGYLTIKINAARDGGAYRWGCDSLCLFCSSEGTFQGDACTCEIGSLTNYNCISVKFAASSLIVPSLVVALVLSILSLF